MVRNNDEPYLSSVKSSNKNHFLLKPKASSSDDKSADASNLDASDEDEFEFEELEEADFEDEMDWDEDDNVKILHFPPGVDLISFTTSPSVWRATSSLAGRGSRASGNHT